MAKQTVAQAAAQVLKSAQTPMTAADVTQAIIDQSLYTFNAKNPRQIVRSAIERRCEGSSRKTGSPAFFKKLGDGRYALKELG
ncbi:winged helix-turn-helix domain-containing protein [Romeria aff. gracilis LEGE 07310]|uniref:Winged helix-turn-helix domain-containing protein n=1 Tax=Vasconcelosia minhoensis LEGE 07310 TaxID=915328 RepID=A0A8J7DP63_9CYAN|nr:winged helix-turn-helix domain-containing protein [Romeria gracilis]MBE9079175.1 winged helix-turn-helix domain-containing protein [Romeria aff. gracilis LEGE 07310]